MSSSITPVAIPKWGIEMVEGTIVAWAKSPGDPVEKGEEIAEIESDKIVNTLEAPASGVLRKVLVEEGEVAQVGRLIGIIADSADSEEAITEFIASYRSPDQSSVGGNATGSTDGAPAPAASSVPQAGGRVSPVIRRLAKELGIDLSTVSGTGRNGRITRDDVELAAKGQADPSGKDIVADSVSETNPVSVTPLTSTRKTIARRLVESKQTVPHFYLNMEIEVDSLLARRTATNDEGGQKVSINDLLVFCASRALMDVREVNAHLIGDDIHQFTHADIAIAVAVERGLITPVLRRANEKTPEEIAAESKSLIEKARAGTLQRSDIESGTFSLSNLGMFGVTRFDAIINPPQVAILALGAARKVYLGERTVSVIDANLACDHRVVDGALGGRFLAAFRDRIAAL